MQFAPQHGRARSHRVAVYSVAIEVPRETVDQSQIATHGSRLKRERAALRDCVGAAGTDQTRGDTDVDLVLSRERTVDKEVGFFNEILVHGKDVNG